MSAINRLEPPPRTGWPPGLLQDDCRKLSRWFASRIDARWVVRQVFGVKRIPSICASADSGLSDLAPRQGAFGASLSAFVL
jgi:hypothetical protein